MTQIYHNGMDRKAVAANNINTENNFKTNNTIADAIKAMLIAKHDGAKDYGSGENGMDFNFSYGDYRIFVVRSYGVWHFNIYKNWRSAGAYDAKLTEQWGGYRMGSRRWSNSLIMDMSVAMAQIIANYESKETPIENSVENTAETNNTLGSDDTLDFERKNIRFENGFAVLVGRHNNIVDSTYDWDYRKNRDYYYEIWRDLLEQTEMSDIVTSYQTEFDGYMEELKEIAPSFYAINTKIDAFAARMIVEKMAQIGKDLLKALGEYTQCEMVEDDGYWLDTDALERWGRAAHYITEMEDIVETLDDMIAESALDFGVDTEDLEFINDGGCYCFDGYPTYLWDDMREFAATYYHYAYCA